jgi:hypothetical protein
MTPRNSRFLELMTMALLAMPAAVIGLILQAIK